jgi:hypothetical protein
MTFETFAVVAAAASATLVVSDADHNGDWSDPRPIASLVQAARDAVARGESDTLSDALSDLTETSVILAVSRKGAVVGAWTVIAWRLGSAALSIEEAYQAVYA